MEGDAPFKSSRPINRGKYGSTMCCGEIFLCGKQAMSQELSLGERQVEEEERSGHSVGSTVRP